MLRDLHASHTIEADYIIGDMLIRAEQHLAALLLALVSTHLKVYDACRLTNLAS